MAQWYRVTVKFQYCDGSPGGVLSGKVYGLTAAETQVDIDLDWLERKGHRPISVDIQETVKPERRGG